LRTCRQDASRRREQRQPKEDPVHFSVITIRVPESPETAAVKSDIGVVLLFPMQSLEEFRSFWLARLERAKYRPVPVSSSGIPSLRINRLEHLGCSMSTF
jgi:hypothetical protein